LHANDLACARAVLDDHLLADQLRQSGRDRAWNRVPEPARPMLR
jgi:hypothetical protein